MTDALAFARATMLVRIIISNPSAAAAFWLGPHLVLILNLTLFLWIYLTPLLYDVSIGEFSSLGHDRWESHPLHII
jgi:hypothetical protein